jgi:RNA-directed DNA polymerase
MTLDIAWHQMPGQPQGGLGRTLAGRGEAASEGVSDEAGLARHEQTHWGAGDLLGQALARENLVRAWKRVKTNKGSAGVDGRTVLSTGERSPGSPQILLTSTSRTARCGPACRVVWEGSDQR